MSNCKYCDLPAKTSSVYCVDCHIKQFDYAMPERAAIGTMNDDFAEGVKEGMRQAARLIQENPRLTQGMTPEMAQRQANLILRNIPKF